MIKAQKNVKLPKRRYNFTDPESRMMMDKGQRHLIYAYNARAAVEKAMGEKPAAITADAGYWDTENVNSEALKGMLALVNPDRDKKKSEKGEGEKRCTNPTMECMRELLKTDEAKGIYKQRKTIVEPVFGQIKQARGIREFR